MPRLHHLRSTPTQAMRRASLAAAVVVVGATGTAVGVGWLVSGPAAIHPTARAKPPITTTVTASRARRSACLRPGSGERPITGILAVRLACRPGTPGT